MSGPSTIAPKYDSAPREPPFHWSPMNDNVSPRADRPDKGAEHRRPKGKKVKDCSIGKCRGSRSKGRLREQKCDGHEPEQQYQCGSRAQPRDVPAAIGPPRSPNGASLGFTRWPHSCILTRSHTPSGQVTTACASLHIASMHGRGWWTGGFRAESIWRVPSVWAGQSARRDSRPSLH